jgi:hypothetical protein
MVVKEVTLKIPIYIVCNCCGDKLDLSTIEIPEINSFQEVSLNFGPSSEHDDQKWVVDLCENCIVKMVKQFKFVPNGFKEDRMEKAIDSTNPGLHQELFEKWKISDKWDYQYKNWFE